jgi:hypothetical protein
LVAVVICVVVGFAAFCVGAANVVLKTRLLRSAINGNPAALLLDYKSAYSIVPGRIHVEGLSIRGRDRHVEWLLTIDRADFSVSLVDLLRRSFDAKRVRASGLAMRVRLRLDRFHAAPDVVAALPPIPGFADPPFLDDGPEPPPVTDANYKLWMVHLEDVDVKNVREVWIHTVRADGDMRVRGRWLFRPDRWLDVGPATVDVGEVTVAFGDRPLADGLSGLIGATVHPFDLRDVNGGAIFDHVSSNGDLLGRALLAAALGVVAPASGIEAQRWEGTLEGHWVVDHGRLGDGTTGRVDGTDCEIEAHGLVFRSPFAATFAVVGGLATIDTLVSGLRVSRLGRERGRLGSMSLKVTDRHLRLAQVFDDAQFKLDISRAETDDLGSWNRLLGAPGWAVRSGTAVANGHAEGSLAARSGRGRLLLSVRRLSVEHGSIRFVADIASNFDVTGVSLSSGLASGAAAISAENASIELDASQLTGTLGLHIDVSRANWAGAAREFSGSGTIAIENASVRDGRASDDWWGDLEVREATLRTNGGIRFDAKAHLTAKDAAPAVAIVSEKTGVPTWAADALKMPGLDADAELRIAPSSLDVRSLVAHGGSTSLRMEYTRHHGHEDGGILLDLGWADLGYNLADGATGPVLLNPGSWFARKIASMRNGAH